RDRIVTSTKLIAHPDRLCPSAPQLRVGDKGDLKAGGISPPVDLLAMPAGSSNEVALSFTPTFLDGSGASNDRINKTAHYRTQSYRTGGRRHRGGVSLLRTAFQIRGSRQE